MRVLALAAVLLAGAAQAAPAPAWVVDKAASSVRFSSSYNGDAFTGAFSRWDADIRFDPANLPASSVTATIDVASARTGDADRDQSIPTPTFLSAAAFPRAVFTAHVFRSLGPGRYVAVGTLSLRGVSRPLSLPFTLAIAGPVARMNATLPLNRLAFGVGQDEWRKTDALPAVVNVAIAVTARRR
ncbi:MAG TPA: YceI family protein [Caulobacteraceae bacterium]|jgi:polyisoprenoid-binding protein YceI|nr:YceI family protein [Caulobacteraceae bacterium]